MGFFQDCEPLWLIESLFGLTAINQVFVDLMAQFKEWLEDLKAIAPTLLEKTDRSSPSYNIGALLDPQSTTGALLDLQRGVRQLGQHLAKLLIVTVVSASALPQETRTSAKVAYQLLHQGHMRGQTMWRRAISPSPLDEGTDVLALILLDSIDIVLDQLQNPDRPFYSEFVDRFKHTPRGIPNQLKDGDNLPLRGLVGDQLLQARKLIPLLLQEQTSPEFSYALDNVLAEQWFTQHINVLEILAPHLSPASARRLLDSALARLAEGHAAAARVIAACISSTARRESRATVEQAFAMIQRMYDPAQQAEALHALAPFLDGPASAVAQRLLKLGLTGQQGSLGKAMICATLHRLDPEDSSHVTEVQRVLPELVWLHEDEATEQRIDSWCSFGWLEAPYLDARGISILLEELLELSTRSS